MKSWWLIVCLSLVALAQPAVAQLSGTNSLVRFHTDKGDIDVIMISEFAPLNVANFLTYVTAGKYDNSFIHRSVTNFVVQGGGFKYVNGNIVSIQAGPAVVNEFHVSNRRGTLAMAKVAGNPNSATNQWFFNESDSNAGAPPDGLDFQNGGFTVFGRIISSSGLTTLNALAAVPKYVFQSPFDSVPLQNNYVYPGPFNDTNLVHVIWVKVVPQIVSLARTNPTTIHLTGRGTPNTTYKLESTGASGAFTDSVNVTTGSQGNFNYDDTSAGARKFYRVTIP
jgi:cyclophilin family peptidyl-prolyl cis-trans isomerase